MPWDNGGGDLWAEHRSTVLSVGPHGVWIGWTGGATNLTLSHLVSLDPSGVDTEVAVRDMPLSAWTPIEDGRVLVLWGDGTVELLEAP